MVGACCHTLKFNLSSTTSKLFLIVIRSILCREHRRQKQERRLHCILDTTYEVKDSTKHSSEHHRQSNKQLTLGEYLCQALVPVSYKSKMSASGNSEIRSCLSALFAVSQSSKAFAVAKGFIESAVEDIRDLHVKLNLASLQLDSDCRGKRKVESVILLILYTVATQVRICNQPFRNINTLLKPILQKFHPFLLLRYLFAIKSKQCFFSFRNM